MIDVAAFREDLRIDEGWEKEPYICSAGYNSIGCGRNIDDEELPPDIAMHLAQHGYITNEMIERLLDKDIQDVLSELYVRMPWATNLNEARQRVLANMLFNMGWGNGRTRLSSFKNTLRAIELGKYHLAAHNMRNSKWARQVGDRAERLAKAMESGTF